MIHDLTVSIAGFWIGLGLTWYTGTGSFVPRSFSLLDRLEILVSTAMDDSMEWIPHLKR